MITSKSLLFWRDRPERVGCAGDSQVGQGSPEPGPVPQESGATGVTACNDCGATWTYLTKVCPYCHSHDVEAVVEGPQ